MISKHIMRIFLSNNTEGKITATFEQHRVIKNNNFRSNLQINIYDYLDFSKGWLMEKTFPKHLTYKATNPMFF